MLVLGDGDEVAAELDRRGHDARSPAEVQRALEAKDREGAPSAAIAETLAAEGREAYVNLDFPLAVTKLSRAIEGTLAAARGELPAGLAALHLDLGIARLAAGERREAEREIALALRLDPQLHADGAIHGPPIVRAVERIRKAGGRSRRRTIGSDPAGAEIAIDGRVRGEAPVTALDLAEGSHYVSASAPGRMPAVVRIEVEGDAETPISIPLAVASPARSALDAIAAHDLDAAATSARAALDADTAIVVRRDGTALGAVAVRRVPPSRTANAPAAAALVDALYPPPPNLRAVGPSTSAPAAPPPERDRDGGAGGWWLLAGGVVLAGAGVVTAILLSQDGGEPGDEVLVGSVERP